MISVCICTYIRGESLQRTLGSLAGQNEIDLDAIEVLVVDNNCTDGIRKVEKSLGKGCCSAESLKIGRASLTLETGGGGISGGRPSVY